jgi:hypothetical protein
LSEDLVGVAAAYIGTESEGGVGGWGRKGGERGGEREMQTSEDHVME